jgi:Actin
VAPLGLGAVRQRLRELLGAPDLSESDAEDIVARACSVAHPSQQQQLQQVVTMSRTLSDAARTQLAVTPLARHSAAEALFDGGGAADGATLQSQVLRCLQECPIDAQKHLLSRVLVVGGGAELSGVCARIGHEIRALAAVDSVDAAADQQRGYSWARAAVQGMQVLHTPLSRAALLWTGTSIMASLEGARDRLLSAQDYAARSKQLPDWLSLQEGSAAVVAAENTLVLLRDCD